MMEHLSRAERPFLWSSGMVVQASAWGPGSETELTSLAALHGAVPLAGRVVVPAAAEATFYRLNQLPSRLEALFGSVASRDPDEDDVEELAPEARALVARHVLDDVFVEAFYEACDALPERLRVRRLGEIGEVALRGRPALLAMRAVWAEAWSDAAIVERLRDTGALMPVPRAVVVHGADVEASGGIVALVARHLSATPRLLTVVDDAVARVVP